MKYILLTYLIFGTLLASCGTNKAIERSDISLDYETVYRPKIEQQSSVNLGDTMMMQGTGWYVDCIVPKFSYTEQKSDLLKTLLVIKRGVKLCGDGEQDNYFYALYDIFGGSMEGKMRVTSTNRFWSVTDIGNNISEWCAAGGSYYCHQRSSKDHIIVKEFRQLENTFQQSIEYMGRSGDILRFIYVEFNENRARTAFNRNFQVDLKEGKTVNYKGAEIEIIEANNLQVTYVIKKYFGGAR